MKNSAVSYILIYSLLLIGSIAGAAIGAASLWIWPAYLVFLLVVLPLFFKADQQDPGQQQSLSASLGLLDNTWVFFMVLGLFLCAGAEVSMSTGLIIWLREEHLLSGFPLWGYWLIFLVSLFSGRLMLPLILHFMEPRPQLLFSVLFVVAGIMMLIMGGLAMAVSGIIITGLGMAGVFALISSLMLHHLPDRHREIRYLMLLSVCGAALLPPFMLWINYGGGTGLGFVVPLFSLLYVFFLAIISKQKTI